MNRKYISSVVVFLAGIYFLFSYESPVRTISVSVPLVERDQRYVELLDKEYLTEEEYKELQLLSYQHYRKLSLDNEELTFDEWRAKVVRAKPLENQ
jgi:sensor histidine kinase YesM